MGAFTGAVLTSAANNLAKKTIESTFDFLVKKYELIDILRFKDHYLEYCEKNLEIKTLVSQDKSFHVDDIYIPIHIMQSGTQTRQEINGITTLDNDRAILIKGLAGQGKSTLLRKLLSNNAKRFSRLPVFYELKNYNGGTLELSISKSLSHFGVKISEHALKKLLSDSNVKIYLDAFDEVRPEFRSELTDEIKRFINSFKCHVICTSRPDTEIDALSEFRTFSVCELTEEQIFGIIKKTASDQEKCNELCDALRRSPLHTNKDSILKSPILVVLFCISYNLGEDIPNTLSQFYSNIFDTVFHRHDNIKGKVYRERHWNDNRRIYRELFDCLCFISLRDGLNGFSHEKLVKFVSISLTHINEECSIAEKAVKELSSITNLIIEDGFNEYRFVHKSIQEFFAASFITSLQHDKKISFYKKCFNDYHFYTTFHNTLFFLEELDYYNYHEYGFIPAITNFLSLSQDITIDNYTIPTSVKDSFLNDIYIRTKYSIFKAGTRESYELEKTNFTFDISESYPSLLSSIFIFSLDFIKTDLTDKELITLTKKNKNMSVNGWCKLSIRTILEFKKLPETVALDALKIGIDVLIRRKFNKAIDKLNNRRESLNSTDYFNF
ncbi:NACHT domain-containing NTPase [Yersinia enterocolitica]|uniref:NACHT domain-containing protein n=1 Tax=Yersinia enterocolitica TaxID=630 RepID=UPI0005DED027|nr:NACHT domain-containing protein [Yersinia enterocolitica]EKN5078096.1 NACHT domain-containing protein [Yersinia enterocolitica]EKN5115597.1 NACHT domain-containing protein [Yersinia enterocolitica]CQJ50932.1 Predicted NTPase (NACHT family) [Yersinia enterocolitica]HDL7175609.1 NACHT domain-containing protein [Yersinia enterocolitica]HDL7177013.1 NACHT domain-containing protein [Yersinia enterocolitica]